LAFKSFGACPCNKDTAACISGGQVLLAGASNRVSGVDGRPGGPAQATDEAAEDAHRCHLPAPTAGKKQALAAPTADPERRRTGGGRPAAAARAAGGVVSAGAACRAGALALALGSGSATWK